MKHKIRLCTLLLLVGSQPLQAALLGGNDAQPSGSTPPPATIGAPTQPAVPHVVPVSPPMPAHSAAPTTATTQPAMAIPQDLTNLSPEQSKQLLQQAKNLNPDQLQAIAKSFQQGQAAQPSQTSQVPQPTATIQTGDAPVPTGLPDAMATGQRTKSLEEIKRDQAFGMLVDDVLPMSPDQITKIHKYYDLTLQAKATPPNPSPTPHFTSTMVNLEPGSQPPVIRLAPGFVTSIIFSDSSCGSPWNLRSYSIGDPQAFNIQWDHKSNTIFIQSLKPYSHGNLAIQLWGLDTPIMLTLVSGQRNLDFRVDLKVPGRNPDCAIPPIIPGSVDPNANVNSLLINILDGVPPRGSIKLHVAGGPGEAWMVDNKIFFRSKLTILSPAWVASVSSPDGTHVYELMLTPSILASQNGKTIDIKLSGL